MTKLSVNVNKIALLRNSRHLDIPSVLWAVETCIVAGSPGITIHPRPDERHIRRSDAYDIAALLKSHSGVEFNIEGNPLLPPFMEIVRDLTPTQCTLVPDSENTFTSDSGWQLGDSDMQKLEPIVGELRQLGCRVSLFMDAGSTKMQRAADLGADRVELYTEPFAAAFGTPKANAVFEEFARAAEVARAAGLGINAGHDLNLENLGKLLEIPGILEVSIGHALVADALRLGLAETVRQYLAICQRSATT